nr:hypothetical protein [Campylobacter jejuni]
MIIERLWLNSFKSSSITPELIGSSAEVGSSKSKSLGLIAKALAIQRRCCCPPERARAFCFNLSLTSSKSPTFCKQSTTKASSSSLFLIIP